MIGTFVFYLSRSLKNRAFGRLRRLRRPKYMISAMAGLGYLYFFFFRYASSGRRGTTALPVAMQFDLLALLETGFAFVLLALVLLPWILPLGRRGLTFSEAEIQFLFPAPIPRRTLVRFRLVKSQAGILFGVLISMLFFRREALPLHPLFLAAGLWTVYSFLLLYRIGTALAQKSIAEHGVSGARRQLSALGLVVAAGLAVGVWMKWVVSSPPALTDASLHGLAAWLEEISRSGPAFYFLYPMRILIRPALASDAWTFLARLIPALAVLGLCYVWIMHSDAGFEEDSIERARRLAERKAAARGSHPRSAAPAGKTPRVPFALPSEGFPHIAILWKNLISIGRISPRRLLPIALAAAALTIAIAFDAGREGSSSFVPSAAGTLAAFLAGFLALLGPLMIRDDLRCDLLRIDLLKSYPIPGWSVVLGEVLAPAAVLTAGEWAGVLVGAALLPDPAGQSWSPYHRLLFGFAAALLLPCCSAIGVIVQNSAVLFMPGWIQLGKEHQQGIEAMGQRLITMIGTVLLLTLAVIPAAALFAGVSLAGYGILGPAVVPIAAAAAAVVLLVEAGAAVALLGRVFDRFDASLELESSGG